MSTQSEMQNDAIMHAGLGIMQVLGIMQIAETDSDPDNVKMLAAHIVTVTVT